MEAPHLIWVIPTLAPATCLTQPQSAQRSAIYAARQWHGIARPVPGDRRQANARQLGRPDRNCGTPQRYPMALEKGAAFCIKNLTMRCILAQARYIPWRYEVFLCFSVERMLMVRQGGSFRFIHRMLREHLAAHPLSPKPAGGDRASLLGNLGLAGSSGPPRPRRRYQRAQ